MSSVSDTTIAPVANDDGLRPATAVNNSAEVRKLLKNSTANLISGVSSAVLALAVPPVLARYLSADAFGAWAIILQISAYASLLNFGIQSAVGRFVAFAIENNDRKLAESIASTAFAILCGAAVIATLMILAISSQISRFFPEWPSDLIPQGRTALTITGITLAVGLPFTTFNGIFSGLQRNEIPAAIIGGSRIVLALVLIAVAIQFRSLIGMAAAYAAINVASYLAQWLTQLKLATRISLQVSAISRRAFDDLMSYSGSFMVWTISMLLVNGIDTLLVGHFDFRSVAVYSACISLITFIGGVQQALFGPLLQVGAQLDAKKRFEALGTLLINSTRISATLLFSFGIFVILFGKPLLRVWLSDQYANSGSVLLTMLAIGTCTRLIAFPYSLLLLATNQHKLVRVGPLLEGVTNVVIATIFGSLFGAIGVAAGLVSGAIVAQLFNFFVNLSRTRGRIIVSPTTLIFEGLVKPLSFFLPCIALWLLLPSKPISSQIVILVSFLLSPIFIWLKQIPAEQKTIVANAISSIRSKALARIV